jgi:hypothetical protein
MNKSVISKTPEQILDPSVRFNVDRLERFVWDKGYDCHLEKALRCPCVNKSTGQALPNCKNCMGFGWFFINKRESRVIIQRMGNNKQFQNIGELTTGTASVTMRAIDRLSYMDKITVMDLEAHFQQIVRPVFSKDKALAWPIYRPLQIDYCFLFKSVDKPLIPLIEGEDYELEDNRISFKGSTLEFIKKNAKESTNISIRYSHNPVYHMLEFDRDMFKARTLDCSTQGLDELKAVPVHGVGKKAHYIWDEVKSETTDLFDNTFVFNEKNP